MNARHKVSILAGLGALGLLAACASTSPQARNPVPPGPIVEGTGTDYERKTIESSENQVYGAEHSTGSDFPVVVSGTNQDIP